MTVPIETKIKETAVPQRGLVIVTTRSSDPHICVAGATLADRRKKLQR